MSERMTTVEDAIWDAQRNYGEDVDADALGSALERAGWSGPSVNFEALADGARAGASGISTERLAEALEGAGWRFGG